MYLTWHNEFSAVVLFFNYIFHVNLMGSFRVAKAYLKSGVIKRKTLTALPPPGIGSVCSPSISSEVETVLFGTLFSRSQYCEVPIRNLFTFPGYLLSFCILVCNSWCSFLTWVACESTWHQLLSHFWDVQNFTPRGILGFSYFTAEEIEGTRAQVIS